MIPASIASRTSCQVVEGDDDRLAVGELRRLNDLGQGRSASRAHAGDAVQVGVCPQQGLADAETLLQAFVGGDDLDNLDVRRRAFPSTLQCAH